MGTDPEVIPDPPAGFTVESDAGAIPPPPAGFTLEGESAPAKSAGFDQKPPDASAQMQRSGIPHELRGYTDDELNAPGSFQNPRTGQRSTVRGDLTRIPIYDAPITGGEEIAHGVEQMTRDQDADKLRGAGHVAAGVGDAASPLMLALAPFAPLGAAAWYALSKGIGDISEGVSERLGLSKEDSQLTGRVATALPMLYGFGKIAEGKFSDAIDAHNERAADLLDQERAHGKGIHIGENMVGPEMPLANTAGWSVVPNGASTKTGRPNYAVVDPNGKTLFAGNGGEVQTWLAGKGVERTVAAMPEEPPAIVEQQQAGSEVPPPPPGFVLENESGQPGQVGTGSSPVEPPARVGVPSDYERPGALAESPLTAEAGQVGQTLQAPEEPSPQEPITPTPAAQGEAIPKVVSPAISDAEIPAPPAGFTVEPQPQLVDAKRLAAGGYDDAGNAVGEGDIRGSYSADKISEGKGSIRKPFSFDGGLWVAVSLGRSSAKAYRLVPVEQFDGTATTYSEKTADSEQARNDPQGFYHGIQVKVKNQPYVMVGPAVHFATGEQPAAPQTPPPAEEMPESTPAAASSEAKPAHEMTFREFRATPGATSVPSGHLLARDPEEPGYWDDLADETKPNIQNVARVMGAPISGNKQQIIDRLRDTWDLRKTLKDADLESLQALSGKELKALAERAGSFKGNKRQTAAGLVNWRNSARTNGQTALAEAKWVAAIQQAQGKGSEIPAAVLQDARDRGLLAQEEAAKQPWQMTADEYIDSLGIKAGEREIRAAHAEHSRQVYQAVAEGKTLSPEVAAEYPNAVAKAPTHQEVQKQEKQERQKQTRIENAKNDLALFTDPATDTSKVSDSDHAVMIDLVKRYRAMGHPAIGINVLEYFGMPSGYRGRLFNQQDYNHLAIAQLVKDGLLRPALEDDSEGVIFYFEEPKPTFKGAEPQAAAEPEAAEPARSVVELPVDQIHVDPVRFQYKRDTGGEAGVGEELKNVRTFDPELGGVIAVWRDPENDKTYVVNGHHRLELAKRTGETAIAARYVRAKSASEARVAGALINIAEGRGTAIDAAKVFRESGLTPAALEARGISLKGQMARTGLALSQLAAPIFDRVVQGELPIERAAVLGEALPDHAEQLQALALIDKAEARGRRPTNAEIKELIDFVKHGPKETVEQSQTSMFGESAIEQNAAWEKAEISDYIRKRLGAEKRLFLAAGNARAAEHLGKHGNVIKAEENARIAAQAAQAQAIYDKLKTSAGPINDALDAAARKLVQEPRAGQQIKSDAYDLVRGELSRVIPGSERASAGRSGGTPESRAGLQGDESAAAPDASDEDLGRVLFALDSEGGGNENLREQGFYSQLERTIENKMPAKLSPEQALATLANPQNGVKPEELKWTGIVEWLKKQTGPLTRDEILERARAEMVTVKEQHGTTRYSAYTLPGERAQYKELLFKWEPAAQPSEAYLTYRKIFDAMEAKYGGERRYVDDYHAEWKWFNDGAMNAIGGDPLTPEERTEYDNAIDAWDREAEAEQRDDNNAYQSSHWATKNVLAHTRFDERTDADQKRVLFIEEIQSDWHQAGREGGYRAREADAERRRLVNRARRLRREGTTEAERAEYFKPGALVTSWGGGKDKVLAYIPASRAPEAPAHERHWRVRVQELLADGTPYGEPRWHSTDPAVEIANAVEQEIKVLTPGMQGRVPDAPFQKNWHELAFRRLVKWAAAHGYDKVGWTTGKQQAARYNLAQYVEGVAFAPFSEQLTERANKFHPGPLDTPEQRMIGALLIRKKGETAYGEMQRSGNPVRLTELPEYLGKEAARKLMEQPLKNGRHTLEGDELQVGGHGMSGFYDSILPTYAAKFGKRWGATVGMTKLDTSDRSLRFFHYEGPEYSIDMVRSAFHIVQQPGEIWHSPFTGQRQEFLVNSVNNTRMLQGLLDHLNAGTPFAEAVNQVGPLGLAGLLGGKAVESLQTKPRTEAVFSLPVTPEMRASLEVEGLPLFAKPLAGEAFERGREYTADELAAGADWQVLPASGRRPARMRLNWQSAVALREVFGTNFNGMVVAPRDLPIYAERLRAKARKWERSGRLTAENAARIRGLAQALEALRRQANGKAVFLYRADNLQNAAPGAQMAQVRRSADTEREELTHVQQAVFARGLDRGKHIAAREQARLTDHPAWPKMTAALAARGYRAKTEEQILEVGAQLIAGKHAELGVSKVEAENWLQQYRGALHATHGPEAAAEVFRYRLKAKERTNAIENHAERRPADLHGIGRGPAETGSGGIGRRAELAERADDDEPSLFDDRTNEEVAGEVARDRDQLQGDRLTAQLNAPLTRDEQLKKLKRSKEQPQTDLFGENEEPPQGSLLFSRDPYIQKFLQANVTPTAKQVADVLAVAKDDVLKLLAPAARGETAQAASLAVRRNAAELARSTDRAEAALQVAKKFFDKQSDEFNFDFIDRVERGEKQPTPELQRIADVMRHLLDTRREAVQALGKGKLARFIENYFPHLWKKPGAVAEAFANYRKQNLEGSKAFLKKRSIEYTKDGLALGLQPVSRNPVELVLLKAREMDKYLAAHRILAQLKEQGLLRYIDARSGQFPAGWEKIDDPAAIVYGQSIQSITEYPNQGLWQALEKVATALGIEHERGFKNLRGAVGRARKGGGIQTLHGTAEDVVAHEIGHQIDWLAGSGRRFVLEYPDAQTVERLRRARRTLKDKGSSKEERKAARQELDRLAGAIQQRKKFAKELRDLADLRAGRKEYTHKREEKMAQLAEMWVGSRELFARTAPTVFSEWKDFLNQNPNLHALRDIEGDTEVTPIAQPYDVGGIVIKGHWWAPEPAARILHNYLSPGLRDKSMLFRGFLATGNLLNQAQLGFSAFHLSFTTIDVATSKMALGIYQLAHGDVFEGIANIAATPLSPFTNVLRGDKVLKEWYAPGTQGARIGALVDAVVAGGGRAHMDSFYQTQLTKRMLEAFRALGPLFAQGRLFGAAAKAIKGAALTPFALMEQTARPIMEYIVPRQKLGVFADLAQYELSRLGTDASDPHVAAALARAWDSVDNRLGQLVYDNLAWNKIIKDLAMASVRSVGWNVGTLREIGGGITDTLRFAGMKTAQGAKLLSGSREIPMREGDEGFSADYGAGGKGEFTTRMSYLIALQIVAGLAGFVAYYLWHGRAPQKLKDYYFPTDAHGHRWSLATYVKDEYAWTHDPTRTAAGKVHPLLALLWEMLANKDYFDHTIANPHHSFVKRQEERANYVFRTYIPIAYRNDKKHHTVTTEERILGFFGIKPAPKALK